jgi:hypothetical protein
MDSYLNTWHILEFMNITTGFLIINHYLCSRSSEGMLLRTALTSTPTLIFYAILLYT